MNALGFLTEELPKIDSFLRLTSSFKERQKELHFPEFSLTELMDFLISKEIFYFESKEEDFAYLGIGISSEFNETDASEFIKKNPEFLVYLGHFEKSTSPLHYLPEWAFIKKNGQITLSLRPNIDTHRFTLPSVFFNLETWESFVSPWTSYEEHPEHDEWSEMINKANQLLANEELQKIVLCRKKIFTYEEPIDTLVMFRELYLYNLNSSHFTLFFQPRKNEAYISFTPERLFTLKKVNFETISLAGSTSRGENDIEDEEFEIILKTSKKLIHEHVTVTKEIEENLRDLIDELVVSPLHTMKLPYIQHRQATIKGRIKETTTPFTLIKNLHPTSAVGGIPKQTAMQKIFEIEKESRFLYAAPIGIISKEYSEIAVGIRSGFIKDKSLTVFGGAGIVKGSEAEEEWEETGMKMWPFTKALNKSVI